MTMRSVVISSKSGMLQRFIFSFSTAATCFPAPPKKKSVRQNLYIREHKAYVIRILQVYKIYVVRPCVRYTKTEKHRTFVSSPRRRQSNSGRPQSVQYQAFSYVQVCVYVAEYAERWWGHPIKIGKPKNKFRQKMIPLKNKKRDTPRRSTQPQPTPSTHPPPIPRHKKKAKKKRENGTETRSSKYLPTRRIVGLELR